LNRVIKIRYKKGQEIHEEFLKILYYKGSANQNDIEIQSHAVRLAIIKKTDNNKCWWGLWGKGAFVCYWGECKLVQTL
jgi:hypothetical protein